MIKPYTGQSFRPADRFDTLDSTRYSGPTQDLYNAGVEIDALLGLDNRGESLWPELVLERMTSALDQIVLALELIEE